MAKIQITLAKYILNNLGRNKITSIGLQTIGSSKFKDFEVIGLSYNNFKDQIKNIRELFDFPKMKEI